MTDKWIRGEVMDMPAPGESVSADGREIRLGAQYGVRALTCEISEVRGDEGDPGQIEFSFSSETPVDRWFGKEVLGHKRGEVDLDWLGSGEAPHLLDHDTREQIGVIESARLDSQAKTARATVRFSRSAKAQEVRQDIADGIKRKISVGYLPLAMRLESEDEETGERVYRVTRWRPLETSSVALPADMAVGVGRDVQDTLQTLTVEGTEGKAMSDKHDTGQGSGSAPAAVRDQGPDREATAKAMEEARQAARDEEKARVAEIRAMGQRYDLAEAAEEAVNKGTGRQEFLQIVTDKQMERIASMKPATELDLSENDKRQYSLVRALRAAADKDWSKAGFELECSRQVAENTGKSPRRGDGSGFFIPWDALKTPIDLRAAAQARAVLARDLATSPETAGGHLVATEHWAADFIDLLRNRMVSTRMGATFLPGLVGNVDIPKQTGAASFQMLGEGGAVSNTDQTFGNVVLSPKTGAASTKMTRRLLLQSTPSVEALVRADLAQVIALGWDDQSLNGDGTGDNATGIRFTTGVLDVVMGDPDGGGIDWAKVVEFETLVSKANADIGSLGYLFNAQTRGTMKTKEKAANTAQFLWPDLGGTGPGEGMVNGYRALVSEQMPDDLSKGTSVGILSSAIYGNWSDLLIGTWGMLDVLVDPYTSGSEGALVIRNFQDFDVAVRHGVSFAKSDDINPAL